MINNIIFCVVLSLFCGVFSQEGARLLFPPPRNFLLQEGYYLNDAPLNCGGIKQWLVNGGQCGVCGDPWDELRTNEIMEQFPEIFMVDNLTKKKRIKLFAELPTKGRGYIEVRLCESKTNQLSQECFDENLLFIEEANSNRYKVGKETQVILTLLLPETIICEKCVLQWKYVKGNKKCLKCQETFINCADIALVETRQAKSKHRVKRQLSQPYKGAPGLVIPTTVPKENIHWIGDNNLKGHIPPQSVLSKDTYVAGSTGAQENQMHNIQNIKPGATSQSIQNQQVGANMIFKPPRASVDPFGNPKFDNIIGALSMLHADPSAATFSGNYPAVLTENSLGRMRSKEDILLETYRKMTGGEQGVPQEMTAVEPVSPIDNIEITLKPELPQMQYVVDPGVTRQRIFTIKPTVPTFSMKKHLKHLKSMHSGSRSHATPRFQMKNLKTMNSLSNRNGFKLSTNRVFKPTKGSTTRVNAPATRAFRWATRQANSLSVSVSGKPNSITKTPTQTNQQVVQNQQNTQTVTGMASVSQQNTMSNINSASMSSQLNNQASSTAGHSGLTGQSGQQTGASSRFSVTSTQGGQQQANSMVPSPAQSIPSQAQSSQANNNVPSIPVSFMQQQASNNMNQNAPKPTSNYMGITDITKILSPSAASNTGGNLPVSNQMVPKQTPQNTQQNPQQTSSVNIQSQNHAQYAATGHAQGQNNRAHGSTMHHSTTQTSNNQMIHHSSSSNMHTSSGHHSPGKDTPSLLENIENSLKVIQSMEGKERNALYVVKSSKDIPKVIQTLEMNKTKKTKEEAQVEKTPPAEQYPGGNEQMLNIKYDTGFSGGRNIPLYVVQTEPKQTKTTMEIKNTLPQTESKLSGTQNVLPQAASKSSMIPPNPPPKVNPALKEPSNVQGQNSISKTVVDTRQSNILYDKPVEPIPKGVKLAGIPDPISSNIVIPQSSQVAVSQNKYPTAQPSPKIQVIAGTSSSGMEVQRPTKMTTLDAILWGVNAGGKPATGSSFSKPKKPYPVSPFSTTNSKPKSEVVFSARRPVFSPGNKAVFSFGYRNKPRTFSGNGQSVFKMPRAQANEVGNQINQLESKMAMKHTEKLNQANKDLMPSQGLSLGGPSSSMASNVVMNMPNVNIMPQQGPDVNRPASSFIKNGGMSGAVVMTGYQGPGGASTMTQGSQTEAAGVNMVSSGLSQSQSKQVQVLTSRLSASGQYSMQEKQKQQMIGGNVNPPNLMDSSVIVPENPSMPADGRVDQAGMMVSEPMMNQLPSGSGGQLSSTNMIGRQTRKFFDGNPEIVVSHSQTHSSQSNPIHKSKVLWSSGVSKHQGPNIIYRDQSNPTIPSTSSGVNPTQSPYPSFSFAGMQSTAMATKVPLFKAAGTTGPGLLETRDFFSRTPIQKVINMKRPSFSFGSKSRNHSPKISYRNSFSVKQNQKMTKAPLNMTPTGNTMKPTSGTWHRVR